MRFQHDLACCLRPDSARQAAFDLPRSLTHPQIAALSARPYVTATAAYNLTDGGEGMAFGKVTKLGVGAAALTLIGIAGIGFAPAPTHTPTQLPTVTVHLNPT